MIRIAKSASLALLAVLLGMGCASNDARFVDSWHTTERSHGEGASEPSAAPSRTVASGDYGPSHAVYEVDGVKYVRGSMGFPTGMLNSSGLLLEKHVPQEVSIGQPFNIEYRVINRTGFVIEEVVVKDSLGGAFDLQSMSPEGNRSGSTVQWNLGALAADEVSVITLSGVATEEGTITLCGVASYVPTLCEDIRVVRSELQITKDLPEEVIICDPINMTIVVTNTGSASLKEVTVTDALPSGLSSAEGESSLVYNVGDLAPGQSKTLTSVLRASRTGSFDNTASASAAGGVEVDASDSVKVTAPSLSVSCEAPENRFEGRPIEVCYTVTNSGDAVANGSALSVDVPVGAEFVSANNGGTLVGTQVQWNLGSLAPEGSEVVCATFRATTAGTVTMTGTATADCADSVSTVCSTEVKGIPAILLEVIDIDDPIEVGGTEEYQITVTNQGSAVGHNIRITCELEDSQEYVSAGGATPGSASGSTITLQPLPTLAPKAKASWSVRVRAVKAGDVRFKVTMLSDEISRDVQETEATNQY